MTARPPRGHLDDVLSAEPHIFLACHRLPRVACDTPADGHLVTSSTMPVNPLLVELICRQLMGVTSPDQDVCTVTCDLHDASLWVPLVEPTATTHASAALASYGLLVAVTGADIIHISGWNSRLLPGRTQRAKQWLARLATPRTRPTDRGADDIGPTPFGARNDAACAGRLADLSPVGYPPGEFAPLGFAPPDRPPQGPNAPDSASLIHAIDAAAEIYQRLLEERIEFAEYMLTTYLTALQSRYAAVSNPSSTLSVERVATDGRHCAHFESTSGTHAVA